MDRIHTSFRELFHFSSLEGFGPPAPEPELAPEPEPEPDAWTGPSQDDWGAVMGYIQAQQEAEARWQAEQAQQQQSPYTGLDPFAENFGDQLVGIIQQSVQQATAPLSDWQYSQQLNEAHDRALDIIADDVAQHGEFMLGEQAYSAVEALANSLYAEQAAKFGDGPKAAESALSKAASTWREYESQLAKAAVERHMNQLTMLGEAQRDPQGAAAGAAQGFRVPPGGDEYAVLEAFGGVR